MTCLHDIYRTMFSQDLGKELTYQCIGGLDSLLLISSSSMKDKGFHHPEP